MPSSLPPLRSSPSPTFTPPPLDGSISCPEIIDCNSKTNASHVLFRFVKQGSELEDVTWDKAASAIHEAARLTTAAVHGKRAVVAILAATGTVMVRFLAHLDSRYHVELQIPLHIIHSSWASCVLVSSLSPFPTETRPLQSLTCSNPPNRCIGIRPPIPPLNKWSRVLLLSSRSPNAPNCLLLHGMVIFTIKLSLPRSCFHPCRR
jgi:hypothetical protein